ncbi:hypothetical protein CSA56_04025 [candidate division KSB3 bacterium]|uniref:Methyl-accepting chemotaxis protein n=1 Tax=candidate division KSB3 bacterium TaxID=2044937 RepID=A0A2G6KKF8_9BACT|nr:MAG: hypothetical protein CSA56_04025 [candidate division KSB3 bacterium]
MNIKTRLYPVFAPYSIKVRLILLFLLIAIIPFALGGYIAYSAASKALHVNVQEKLLRISMTTLDSLDRVLLERQKDTQIWSTLELAKLAPQIGSGIGGASEFVNQLIKRYRMYNLIMLLDVEGTCVTVNTVDYFDRRVPTNELFLGQNFQEASWFQKALHYDDVVITDWHYSPILAALAAKSGEADVFSYTLIFSSAIRDVDGTTIGVWVNFLHWQYIQELLEQIPTDQPEASASVKSLLLLPDNDTIIASSNIESRDGTSLYGKSLSRDLNHAQLTAMLIGLEKGVFSYSWDGISKTVTLVREQGFDSYFGKGWGYLMISDNASADAQILALRTKMMIFGSILTVLLVIIAYTIGHRVAHPLTLLSETTSAIANGDLTRHIALSDDGTPGKASQDEVTVLLHSFGKMTQNLQHLIRQIKEASQRVNEASSQIATALHQLSSTSTQQSSTIIKTTRSIEEISASSRQIAQNATSVAEFVETTEQQVHTGVKAAVDTLACIHAIKQANDQNMEHVQVLHARSKEIYEIVEVITAIAEHTDLIAFNAALEAAGAGEKGRRFSVVADEIRHLANTVATSVTRIKHKTSEIQQGVHALVATFETETERIETGVTDMQLRLTSLESILGKIEKTTTLVTHISDSTWHQQMSHEQMVPVLHKMSQETLGFQEITQNTLHIVAQLNLLAEELQQSVDVFQLE